MEKFSSYPEVSVIIPLYNAEKYIAECLESLLIQTFPNFEVIVVDDCSTDSSCAIVESYAPKFGGRLTLSHMRENTGSGALPRNKGMRLSRGEYIFFLDADDLFTQTAIEEMYTLAREYDADVVYCEKFYGISSDLREVQIQAKQAHVFVDKPTWETNDLPEKVNLLMQMRYCVTPWNKLVRRDIIMENDIFFPHVVISEDNIWTYVLLFYAKKFLRVPNIVYLQRYVEDSMRKRQRTPQQTINFWINPVLLGLKTLDTMLGKHEFFQQNPQYRYAILEMFVKLKMSSFLGESFQLQPFEVYDTIKKEFGSRLGEHDVLISALCTSINTQQKINAINQQKFEEFATKAQARIAELEAELEAELNRR